MSKRYVRATNDGLECPICKQNNWNDIKYNNMDDVITKGYYDDRFKEYICINCGLIYKLEYRSIGKA